MIAPNDGKSEQDSDGGVWRAKAADASRCAMCPFFTLSVLARLAFVGLHKGGLKGPKVWDHGGTEKRSGLKGELK